MSATPEEWKPGTGAWSCGYVKQWDEKGGRTISIEEYRTEVLAQVGRHLVEIYQGSRTLEAEPLAVNIGEWLQRGALWEGKK